MTPTGKLWESFTNLGAKIVFTDIDRLEKLMLEELAQNKLS